MAESVQVFWSKGTSLVGRCVLRLPCEHRQEGPPQDFDCFMKRFLGCLLTRILVQILPWEFQNLQTTGEF